MDIFNPFTIGIFLINIALAVHVVRSGRSMLWFLALAAGSFMGLYVNFAVWMAYLFVAVLPDLFGGAGMRNFTSGLAQAADPGRAYREKKRQVAMVGSAEAKRDLAEESLKRGMIAEAVELYESAMQGPIGQSDPSLIKGLARAKMLSGDGAGAENLFVRLKELDPAAFDADAELDYARALEIQGKNDAAVAQYAQVVPRYPGEEARCRFGLLLEKLGQATQAQNQFREILESMRGAPGYYRRRQREWASIARQHLR